MENSAVGIYESLHALGEKPTQCDFDFLYSAYKRGEDSFENNQDALCGLGKALLESDSAPHKKRVENAEGFKLLEQAISIGSADAAHYLGVLYDEGTKCKRNRAKAVEMYQFAAKDKHPKGLYSLGLWFVFGVGLW